MFSVRHSPNPLAAARIISLVPFRHYIFITLLGVIVFLPNVGHGFIHDDFVHLHSAAFDSAYVGLTSATGGTFYAPLTWLSFRMDWAIWGYYPFASALVNLSLHIANSLLVYSFVRYTWRSDTAAFWACVGFLLLLPSSVWAVMWVASRGHVIATLFYLATLHSCVWWTRTNSKKAVAATIFFGTAAIFSKEIGSTICVVIPLVLFSEREAWRENKKSLAHAAVMTSLLFAASVLYMWLRSRSGAVAISFGESEWYSYSPSLFVAADNMKSYMWRTFGVLSFFVIAAAATARLNGAKYAFRFVARREFFAITIIFLITISPVILLAGRSGMYTYLPGAIAAILMGSIIARQPNDGESVSSNKLVSAVPAAIVILIFGLFAIGQSAKWVRLAETSESVLSQLKQQLPNPAAGSRIVIEYSERDLVNHFPDSFDTWGFEPAVRLTYREQSLSGSIASHRESGDVRKSEINYQFDYAVIDHRPVIMRK